MLQSESYLRHLEQRISTLNKLENSYNVHLKMKDGIQNMFDAYKKSPGNQNKNLANIKLGWKDCIQVFNNFYCYYLFLKNGCFKDFMFLINYEL